MPRTETAELAGPSRAQSAGILAGSVAAAVSTFVIMIVANRALGGRGAGPYNEFLIFWAFLFWLYSLASGLLNEATRASGAALVDHVRGARIQPVALALTAAIGVVALASAPLWGPVLTPSTVPAVLPVMAAGVVLYGVFQALQGTAAGRHRWWVVGGLNLLDAVGRLVAVTAAALLRWGLLGVEIAAALGGALFAALLATRDGRQLLAARGDVAFWPLARRMVLAMVSSAATGVLVVAYPTLIAITNPHSDPAVAAGTLTALSLTRAPIMMPLLAFQGVAISAFLANGRASLRPLLKPVLAVAALGLLGAPVAALVGPWVLRVFYVNVAASGITFALLVLATVVLAVLTLTGAAVIALDRHGFFAAGWLVAAVTAFALLYLPMALAGKVALSLAVGPLLGIPVHLVGIGITRRRLGR